MGDYVQYGAGLTAPQGWRHFDASPTLRLQRLPLVGGVFRRILRPVFPRNVEYGDIIAGLPVRAESCSGIYCSHVLEHLALHDFRRALRNTRRYLGSDGVFRLVVPDLAYHARKYLDSPEEDAALAFLRETYLGREARARGSRLLRSWFGNSAHLWMWDQKAMTTELREAGFRDIRRARFGDSVDRRFSSVEDEDRWKDCLGIECRA